MALSLDLVFRHNAELRPAKPQLPQYADVSESPVLGTRTNGATMRTREPSKLYINGKKKRESAPVVGNLGPWLQRSMSPGRSQDKR